MHRLLRQQTGRQQLFYIVVADDVSEDILGNIRLLRYIRFCIVFLLIAADYRSTKLAETVAGVGVGAEDVLQVAFQEKLAQRRSLDTDVPVCPANLELAHVMRVFEIGYLLQ
ncbi:hypothetical protein ACFLWI_02265 [Chloroflexota bacterium]